MYDAGDCDYADFVDSTGSSDYEYSSVGYPESPSGNSPRFSPADLHR